MTAKATGIVGIGQIGGAIARNLLAAGQPVVGWARRPEALDRIVAAGARAASSLADLGCAPVVLSIVFDDAAVAKPTPA